MDQQDYKIDSLKAISLEEVGTILHNLQVHQIELEMQNEELRQMQRELDEAKNRYFNLYNKAPIGYLSLDNNGTILETNLTASSLLGIPSHTLLKQPFSHFVFNEDQDSFYRYRQKFCESDEPQFFELRIVRNDGIPFWVCMVCRIDRDSYDTPIFNIVMNDIDTRKKMEEELKRKDELMILQSRQATMGEMISMIAHQWRQPLNIMGIAISNIETNQLLHTLDQETLAEKIQLIAKNIVYMSATIDDFRNFFKPNQSKEETSIGNVIHSVFEIIGKSLENNNIVVTLHNSSQMLLWLYKNQLIQVLLNIINNAKDALISNNVTAAAIDISVEETLDVVVISICDNAGGIPEQIKDKINEPYFTTKEFNGTGLGLYIAQIIIEKYLGGTLSWYNKGSGVCFVITLQQSSVP